MIMEAALKEKVMEILNEDLEIAEEGLAWAENSPADPDKVIFIMDAKHEICIIQEEIVRVAMGQKPENPCYTCRAT